MRMEPYRDQDKKDLRHLPPVEALASAGFTGGGMEKMKNVDATEMNCINHCGDNVPSWTE